MIFALFKIRNRLHPRYICLCNICYWTLLLDWLFSSQWNGVLLLQHLRYIVTPNTYVILLLQHLRYIFTPTPTVYCYSKTYGISLLQHLCVLLFFVKLILIASIKPHYSTPNNSKWLSQLTVAGAKKTRTMRKVLNESVSSPHIFTKSQYTHTHTNIYIYICVCIWIVIELLARLTCRTNSNSPFWYVKNS